MKKFYTLTSASALLITSLQGCIIESHERYESKSEGNAFESWEIPNKNDDNPLNDYWEELEEQDHACQQKFNKWKNIDYAEFSSILNNENCDFNKCNVLPVNVTYLLPDPLEGDRWLVVEAFDNPFFIGSPTALEYEPGFGDLVSGDNKSVLLAVPEGEYYIRAWLKDDVTPAPYDYLGMQLVGDSPIGYHGVSSSANKVIVDPRSDRRCLDVTQVNLDKEFKNPELEPETNARIRIKFTNVNVEPLERYRKVYIQLHRTEDINYVPIKEYSISSELFWIEGRIGKAEFVTPNLDEDEFFVFTYLDTNENGFFDKNEPSGKYKDDEVVSALTTIKNRTANVSINLQ